MTSANVILLCLVWSGTILHSAIPVLCALNSTTPSNQTVIAGSSLTLSCSTDRSTELRWMLRTTSISTPYVISNGLNMSQTTVTRRSVKVTDNGRTSLLTINRVETTDTGEFICQEMDKDSNATWLILRVLVVAAEPSPNFSAGPSWLYIAAISVLAGLVIAISISCFCWRISARRNTDVSDGAKGQHAATAPSHGCNNSVVPHPKSSLPVYSIARDPEKRWREKNAAKNVHTSNTRVNVFDSNSPPRTNDPSSCSVLAAYDDTACGAVAQAQQQRSGLSSKVAKACSAFSATRYPPVITGTRPAIDSVYNKCQYEEMPLD